MQRSRPARALLAAVFAAAAWTAAPLPAAAADAPANNPGPGPFDPRELFAPLDLPEPANGFRDAAGLPGPLFWQNRADYDLKARIDPDSKSLSGEETITYTNNSPDALDVLWLQLDQNIYRRDSRASLGSGRPRQQFTDGYQLAAVEVGDGGAFQPVHYLVDDTRLRVDLPRPLAGGGKQLKLHIRYRYTVPGPWGGRTAVTPTQNGEIYEIAQWFPRMAVYDDLRGWDTLPYLGSEFYLEYGTIDYAVTVPWNYLVVGSGELANPQEVLTATERRRLAEAAGSDRTVFIRSAGEVGDPASRPTRSGTQTWRFHMEHTRDVAFAASPAFIWDAARINLPGGRHALAMSAYPVEAAGKGKWARSTEYLKGAVEHFSEKWYPFPWPVAVNVAGHGANMEYPALAFDGIKDADPKLFWVTAHEIGHSWFPMTVGSNERRHAFMDEGFNVFVDVYASDAFNHGEFAPKRDSEYAPKGGNPVDEILPLLADPNAPNLMAPADGYARQYGHTVSYYKGALGLILLREQILGPERFDPAFRKYVATWAFKHPSASDFFRLMQSEAGEDLSWWWRGWYFNNWQLDMGITAASYVDGDAAKGVQVSLASRQKLVMPATLRVDYADGSHEDLRIPVEAWRQSSVPQLTLPTTRKIRQLTLDPDHKLPDADRGNNSIAVN
jgi:hypothetical protein